MAVFKTENHQGLNSKANSPIKQRHMEEKVPFFSPFYLIVIFSSISLEFSPPPRPRHRPTTGSHGSVKHLSP